MPAPLLLLGAASADVEPITPLLVAAGVAELLWFAAVGILALIHRPRDPEPSPASPELGGDPPALVNLLCSGFKVTTEAVPATLLDLAARRHVDIDPFGPDRHVLRVRSKPAGDLAPYEAQVLSHLRGLAVDGIVPAEALTTGPADASAGWWRRFRKAVVAEAQRRGLCQKRWPGRVVGALWAAGLVPGLLYLAGTRFRDPEEVRTTPLLAAVLAGLLLLGFVAVSLLGSTSQRDTPAGLAAASRWLGLRAYLASSGTFPDLPPSAVVLWERHLAYAAALGVAPAAVRALPLGAEDDRVAWSRHGGRWRRVRIRYPRFRPAWGLSPPIALALAVMWLAVAALALLALLRIELPVAPGLLPEEAATWIGRVIVGLRGAAGLLGLMALAVALRATADLAPPGTVTGTVLRLRSRPVVRLNPWRQKEKRRYHVAVDDGSSPGILAWSVRPALYRGLSQGREVRAVVTPGLRHVRELEKLPAGAAPGEAEAAP